MLPSNTIDFDSAKLQRLGLATPQPIANQPVSLVELHHQLNLQLQASLDPERILGRFFEQVRRLVPLDALTYRQPDSEPPLAFGEDASHTATYRLSSQGEPLGELAFRRHERFDDSELAHLESLLASLSFPLRNALLYQAAVRATLSDPLTRAGSRAAMEQDLVREVEVARRHAVALSVLMVDLDHFKRTNDVHGHQAGDDALRLVAGTLKAELRTIDRLYRFGGEEFVVLLGNTDHEASAAVGERLRKAVAGLQFSAKGQAVPLTISLGGASLLPEESVEGLLRRADMALYQAKRGGRDRLCMAD